MRQRYHYIIVFCCFLSLFVNIGLPSTSFAVYQPSIVALVGDAAGSTILAVRILVSVLAITVVDRYYDMLDTRRGLGVSMLLTAAGFGVYSVAASLPVFLVGAVLCGIAYGMGGMMATTMLVNRWFKGGIGTAVGVASVGSGVAGTVMPVVAARVISAASLAAAFRVAGAVALVLALVVFALLRNRPSDLGLQPYEPRARKEGARAGRSRVGTVAGGPGDVALPLFARRLLFAAMMMVGAFSMGGVAYISVLLIEGGFDAGFAATLVSVTGLCLTVAKFLVGELFDRIGAVPASAIMFGVLVVGFVLLCFAVPLGGAAAVVGAACVGSGLSLGTVGISVWSLQLSDAATRQRSIKNGQLAFSAGGFAMNVLPGPLKLLTGTYVTSYAVMLACGVLAAVVILGIYARMAKS